jgi:hypothetical protein
LLINKESKDPIEATILPPSQEEIRPSWVFKGRNDFGLFIEIIKVE